MPILDTNIVVIKATLIEGHILAKQKLMSTYLNVLNKIKT
jgi:hypothetical protein